MAKFAIVLLSIIGTSMAFECYTCNSKPNEDDSLPCVDRRETCPTGVTSCSSVAYTHVSGSQHTRKFCTAPGTPIYQYLVFFPGSALCQNIETVSAPTNATMPEPLEVDGVRIMPPAPPQAQTSNLLCVCTKALCNGGAYRDMMDRILLQNMKQMKPEGETLQTVDTRTRLWNEWQMSCGFCMNRNYFIYMYTGNTVLCNMGDSYLFIFEDKKYWLCIFAIYDNDLWVINLDFCIMNFNFKTEKFVTKIMFGG